MVARKDPRSLAGRVRRLEFMLMALAISLGDELDDEPLWFDFRHILHIGSESDPLDSPEFEHFLDRLINKLHRSKLPSVLEHIADVKDDLRRLQSEVRSDKASRQVEKLRSEVHSLRSKLQSTQIETHSLLAIQALGLPSERIQFIRYVPVRAYIDEVPDGAIDEVSEAVVSFLAAFGFAVADEFPEIKGSWFKKWFAKSKNVLSQPEVIKRLEEIERAVELKAIDKPQADVDDKQASAIAKLIKCLDKVPNAALQAGSVLVVKLTTNNGPVIQARTLSQEEMIELENNQLLLQNPAEVLGKLNAACSSAKRIPRAKSGDAGG